MTGVAHAPREVIKTPEQAAKNLFPLTAIAMRLDRTSTGRIERNRRAYLDGVVAYRDCSTRMYFDAAERLVMPKPRLASSYDNRELQAFGWGWDDALGGRFEEDTDVTRAPESEYRGPVSANRPGRRAGTSRGRA